MTDAVETTATRDPALIELEERVAKGITWLVEHDPTGSFHHWFEAGLIPSSPMPAQSPETIAAWKEYHRQRTRWESLSRDLARVDPEGWGKT